MTEKCEKIKKALKKQSNNENIAGMARFGISTKNTLGVPMPVIRKMANEYRKDQRLALALWSSGIHEARILACLIAEAQKATEEQMDQWVREFDSWDVCDQCCGNYFDKTAFAYSKAQEWADL